MGMDPATATLIGSAIMGGGSALGRIFAPQGQKLMSFEGSGATDPHAMLNEAKNMLEGVYGLNVARASSPVDMSDAYVQSPPSYTGGALPMPIGVTGSWGANKPGATTSSYTPSPNTQGPDPGPNGGSTRPDDNSPDAFKGLASSLLGDDSGSIGPTRKTAVLPSQSQGLGSTSTNTTSSTDPNADSTKAIGAVSLLLHLAKPGDNRATGLGF